MARIQPLDQTTAEPGIKAAFAAHVAEYKGRITNMKATLGHSLIAFEAYMQWYPLYTEVQGILGNRLAYLYAHAISTASNCPLCSTFFRRIIIDAGEKPEDLVLTDWEQLVLDFGSVIAAEQGQVPEALYRQISSRYNDQEMVILIAFAGQMIATNLFNNVIETEIDEYLTPYLPLTSTTAK